MNFCRGTGLQGLTGIPPLYSYIRRPLLNFTKEELMEFAKENKLDYVEDSSNKESKYTRNLFRNEVLPLIAKAFPRVKENLQDNIQRFSEINKLYQYAVGEIKKKICRRKGAEIHIPVKQLMAFQNRALLYEIIHPYGFSEKQIDELIKLAGSESGRYLESGNNDWRIIRHRHWFIITPLATAEAENIIIDEKDQSISFPGGRLLFEKTGQSKPVNNKLVACLDAKQIQYPLLLRKWKTGDYFYPLGMKKKKKLARFFIDQQLSKADKEKVWVIESNKRIAWVTGLRIDDRFKVTEKTTGIMKITLSPLP
jgi:tRNA(Ile)-lysidine synthase